jgi:hypothetical protein
VVEAVIAELAVGEARRDEPGVVVVGVADPDEAELGLVCFPVRVVPEVGWLDAQVGRVLAEADLVAFPVGWVG